MARSGEVLVLADSLIQRLQAGDDGAVLELASVYSGKIYRVAFRYLRNRERGLSTAQAGAALALKEQTLKSRLHRAHLMLRDSLSDFSAGLASRKRRPGALSNAVS